MKVKEERKNTLKRRSHGWNVLAAVAAETRPVTEADERLSLNAARRGADETCAAPPPLRLSVASLVYSF